MNVIGSFEVLPSTIDTDAPASESDGDGDDHLKDLSTCILSYYNENMIIVHPDVLVSATRVSDAPICRRKAVVQEKLRGPSSETPALVYGNLLHELFQTCLLKLSKTRVRRNDPKDKQSAFDESSRWATIDKLLQSPKNIESLFTIGIELDAAREYLRDKSTGFADFADRFVAERPKVESSITSTSAQILSFGTDLHSAAQPVRRKIPISATRGSGRQTPRIRPGSACRQYMTLKRKYGRRGLE